LCIVDAFPVGAAKAALLRGLLLRSAEKYEPSSTCVLEQLLRDSDYMVSMLRLVCFLFSIIPPLNLSCCSHMLRFQSSKVKPSHGVT
jgi:hypothetical protein